MTKISALSMVQAVLLMIFSPTVVILLENFGYRGTLLAQGAVCGGIVLLAALTLAIFVGAPKAAAGMVGVATFRSLFGVKAIGTLVALGTTASAIGSMIAPPVASAIFEATGSYTLFLVLCVGLLALVCILVALATSKSQVDKINAKAEQAA